MPEHSNWSSILANILTLSWTDSVNKPPPSISLEFKPEKLNVAPTSIP